MVFGQVAQGKTNPSSSTEKTCGCCEDVRGFLENRFNSVVSLRCHPRDDKGYPMIGYLNFKHLKIAHLKLNMISYEKHREDLVVTHPIGSNV